MKFDLFALEKEKKVLKEKAQRLEGLRDALIPFSDQLLLSLAYHESGFFSEFGRGPHEVSAKPYIMLGPVKDILVSRDRMYFGGSFNGTQHGLGHYYPNCFMSIFNQKVIMDSLPEDLFSLVSKEVLLEYFSSDKGVLIHNGNFPATFVENLRYPLNKMLQDDDSINSIESRAIIIGDGEVQEILSASKEEIVKNIEAMLNKPNLVEEFFSIKIFNYGVNRPFEDYCRDEIIRK